MKLSLPEYLTGAMARHSSANLAMRIFGLGSGFLFAVAAARLLGPAGYGIVAVAISAATVLAAIAVLGLDGLALRHTAALVTKREWDDLRLFIRWACLWVMSASAVAALLMLGVSGWSDTFGSALRIAAIAVPLLAGILLLKSIILGSGQVIASQIPNEVVRWIVILPIVAVLLVLRHGSPELVILAVVAGLVSALVVSGRLLRGLMARWPGASAIDPKRRKWLHQAMPFLAISVFGIIGTEISTLLLGWLSGPREAGLYQPIAKLAPIMLLATYSIETALAPRITQKWEAGDHIGLQRLMRRSAFASTIATTLISAAILLASPLILGAFGSEFAAYKNYLYWIAAAQLTNAALGASPLLLAMVGDMRHRLQAQAVNMVVQLGLAVALIPALGALGAVISLSFSILVWAGLHWWLAWRTTGIDTSVIAAWRV
jgi:O-antigen/teichoic acid export membrane protein